MSTSDQTADELAIRDLAARYIDAVNRRDGGAWQATWSEQGSWHLMGMEVSGRDALLPFWETAMAGFEMAIMVLNSGTVNVSGDGQASGRWYVTEHLRDAQGAGNLVLGVYDDRYCREDGNWRFEERRYTIIYRGPADLSGDYQPFSG